MCNKNTQPIFWLPSIIDGWLGVMSTNKIQEDDKSRASQDYSLGRGKDQRPRAGKGKKVHAFDIVLLCSESPPQKRSGMARVQKGFHSFTCTVYNTRIIYKTYNTRSSAIGMSHTFLCLPSYNWYSFTDLGGMEGSVDLGVK